jgi:hypothetical protein
MENQLFIPTKIKVGFNNRKDTYTKKLAYIIYYDSKGVLRKEKSWEGWRNKSIDPVETENIPHSGFVINKGILRQSDWGNGHNMVRVYDDRGFEFEITTSNLMFILMTTDCLKRGLEGEFVYAWWGKELILLPTDCDEYCNSMGYSKLQGQKVGVKDLIAGAVYETKKQEKLIYLGRFNWFDTEGSWNWENDKAIRKAKKKFVFVDKDENVVGLPAISSLSRCVSNVPIDNYADLIDKFRGMAESSKIVSLEFGEPKEPELKESGYIWSKYCYDNLIYFDYDNEAGEYNIYTVGIANNSSYDTKEIAFSISKLGTRFILRDGELITKVRKVLEKGSSYGWGSSRQERWGNESSRTISKAITLQEFTKMKFPALYVTLEDGNKYLLRDKIKLI